MGTAAVRDVCAFSCRLSPTYCHVPMSQLAAPSMLSGITLILRHLLDMYDDAIGSRTSVNSFSKLLPTELEPGNPAHDIIQGQQNLAWYPLWPPLYDRPHYAGLEEYDGRCKERGMYKKCDDTSHKVRSGQNLFNPGIFKATCPHGFCYGCHFMKDHESPSDLFTLLLTRWPRDSFLSVCWYDNMCKAYEYIIKREPWMLQKLRSFVDSFHFGSHHQVSLHKCPAVFDTKRHVVARLFNSQYEEHGNAFLDMFRRSVRTMGLARALQLIGAMLRCAAASARSHAGVMCCSVTLIYCSSTE